MAAAHANTERKQMQSDKPDFTADAEGEKLAKEQERQRRLQMLYDFKDRPDQMRPRRKRFYARTIERRRAQVLNKSEWYNCGGKLRRRPNPTRARYLRASWPLQWKCAVMGWVQLIWGKENVKITEE